MPRIALRPQQTKQFRPRVDAGSDVYSGSGPTNLHGPHGVGPFIDPHRVQTGDAWQAVEVGVYRDDLSGAHALHHGRMQEVRVAYPRMVVRQPRPSWCFSIL